MDVTPDTVNFLTLGYAVIFGCMAIYLVSLVVRFRSLRQDQKALDEVEDKGSLGAVQKELDSPRLRN